MTRNPPTIPITIVRTGLRSLLAPLLVVLGVLVLWVIAATALTGRGLVPQPLALLTTMAADAPLLLTSTASTLSVAAQGFLAAVIVVLPLAALGLVAPTMEPIVLRVAIVVHVMPTVAIAPLLTVALPGDAARVVITALSVYFPLLIGTLLGLKSADTASREVVRVAGGRGLAELRFVRLPASVPNLLSGLQVGVPAAVLGAMISEFFGAERGLGAVLVSAQESLLLERTWAIAVVAGVVASLGFALVALAGRLLFPWARERGTVGTSVAGAGPSTLRRRDALLAAVISAVVILGSWQALTSVFGLDEYFAKPPLDTLLFLFDGSPFGSAGPAPFWEAFLPALGETAVHAMVGLVVGTAVAVAFAVAMVANDGLHRALMPFAIALRSVPLMAMTPLIVLLFGRDLLGVTVIVTLVTFFPTLVTVIVGLQSTPTPAIEVVKAAGGNALTAIVRVRILYAVPSLLASVRISLPASIAGATLAEWLATGDGLGSMLTRASVMADYYTLWAAGALLVLVTFAAYAVLGVVADLTTRRLGITA